MRDFGELRAAKERCLVDLERGMEMYGGMMDEVDERLRV